MLIWNGVEQCVLCDGENPVTFIVSPMGHVSLCLNCTLRCLGITVEQWEDRHRPFRNHLADRLKRAMEIEAKRNLDADHGGTRMPITKSRRRVKKAHAAS